MTTIFDNPLSGYRFVDTQIGDTLQEIAYRELGDAAQWPLLIAYNKLVYPWLTDDPTKKKPGVILAGGQILVPAPVPVISSTTDPTKVFEIDIALSNGQLQAGPDGDFLLVAGVNNLTQALENRLDTDCGELIFHPEYGQRYRQLIGSMNGPNTALLAGAYASSAVLNDERISAVISSEFTIEGTAAEVALEVTPVVGRSIKITSSV